MELFKIFGTVALNNSEAIKGMNDTADTAEKTGNEMAKSTEKAESKMSSAFSKIGKGAIAVGKTIASGIAVGTVAIAGLAKKSLDAYADYEQLVGGVETLFKDASEELMGFANVAYKTAGLSANEYMETVTSFSASLIQSLNGDTVKASKVANQAIIDMSDNANKMGTAMESIQNAYQGFAKQNYTMLDNLKLGYGGTKEEMARLLADAQAISGIEYNISSYADVVEAIHVIQNKMGITGTTAKEASATISGSISAMKSAFSNLLAGFGNDDADLSALTDQFVETFTTVMHNVAPRLQVILGGMADVIAQVIPIIAEKLPELLDSLLPPLIEGAVALLNGLVSALPTLLQIVITQLPFIITEVGKSLIAMFPVLLATVKDLIGQLIDFIGEELFGVSNSSEIVFGIIAQKFNELWGICSEAWATYGQPVWDSISVALNWVRENYPVILESASSSFQSLWNDCKSIWDSIGQPIWDMLSYALNSVMNLFGSNMPAILGFFQEAIAGIKDTWENHLKPMLDAIGDVLNNHVKPAFEYVWKNVIEPLIRNVFSGIGTLWTDTLKPVFDNICDFITGVFTGNWKLMCDSILGILEAWWNGVKNSFLGFWNFLCEVWENIKDDVLGIMNSIYEKGYNASRAFIGKAMEIFTKLKDFFGNIWSGIWTTTKGYINNIIGGIEGMVNGIVSGVNGIINGINSVISKAGEMVGLSIAIPTMSTVSLPRLEKGGVLEKGQVGLLEGNGAEAVVPLDQNEKWINKVAQDMNSAVGSNEVLYKILDALNALREELPEEIASMRFEINNREFARLVKGV